MWKSPDSSKVVVFLLKDILGNWDHIPTRRNLVSRNLIHRDSSSNYVFYDNFEETSIHLFLHCLVLSLEWRKVLCSIGINLITQRNVFSPLEWRGVG